MKSWLKVMLVVALAVLLGSTLLGCGGGAGPEATVRDCFKAMEAKDAEKMASYFVADMRDEMLAQMEMTFEMVDKIKISNVKTQVVSQEGDRATVEFEFDMEMTMAGQTQEQPIKETAELEKVGGKWLITETFE